MICQLNSYQCYFIICIYVLIKAMHNIVAIKLLVTCIVTIHFVKRFLFKIKLE